MTTVDKPAVIKAQIANVRIQIAIERDKLRDLIDEAEALETACEDAVQHLDSAADCLSQWV